MTLAFAIPDTAPFIHYDPLTRWTSAYAPAKDGRGGDETYHQAGVAMAGIDFNITASTLNIQTSASPLAPAAPNTSDTSASFPAGCGLLVSINGSAPTSTCSLTDLPKGIHRVNIKAEREGTRVLGIDGEVAAYGKGQSKSKSKSKDNGGPRRVIDHKAPEWKYQGSWTSLDSSSGADVKKYGELKRYEGGSASVSGGTARAQLDFQGEAIWLYGFSGPYGGAARVWMDGVEMANLNMTLPWAGYQSLLFFQAGLDGKASHTLTFDALGKGEVVLDYAVVMGSSDENWLQANLPTVIGGISGLLALILLLCLGTYLYLLRRGRRIREAHGWTRIPGSGVFGARYLPPGQAHSVEQWRKTSSLTGDGMEMYSSEDGHGHGHGHGHGFGDKGSVSSPSAALLAGGAEHGVVRGYHHAGSPGYSPSRSMSSHMRALPYTATSMEYGRVQPGSASIASTLLSPPIAYRSPGMSASASPGPIGSNPLQGNSSPFPFHVNRPPASPGYLPYTGPIETSPYSTKYASGTGKDYAAHSGSRLPGVVGGSAAAREWLQRSTSRRSKASTATVRSGAGSRAATPLRGAAGSVVGSGSAKSDISSVLGTGTGTGRTHSRGTSASGHSIVSPHTPLSGGHVSSSSNGQGRGLVGSSEPHAAYRQPGREVRSSPHGSGREELDDEYEQARERERGRYEEDKRKEMADWARSVGSRTPLSLSSAGTATATASMMERGSGERIRSQGGSTSAHMSSVSGFSSELGEPFTAMIGTISANPLSHSSTGLERGGSANTGINKRESDRDIIAKYWPITAASPHTQRDMVRGSSTGYFDSGDRIERTIDGNTHGSAEQHQQHDHSADISPVQRTPPRLPLSVSSRTLSVAGAAPSSRILPSSGGITPASTGVLHTPISAPGREIALTPATSMTLVHSGGLLRSSHNPAGSSSKAEIIGIGEGEVEQDDGNGVRRSVHSVKSSKTDRSFLSFLRGPGEDPWSSVIGRAGVQGGDAHGHGMPAMPQTAARPDSQMIHPYGRKLSVGAPLRADIDGVGVKAGVGGHTGVGAGEGAVNTAEGRTSDDEDTVARVPEKHGKVKKLPPPPLGLGLLHPPASTTSAAGSARVSVPVSEEGMRNWVIELDPNSPTTTVGRSVSRPHSYARGW